MKRFLLLFALIIATNIFADFQIYNPELSNAVVKAMSLEKAGEFSAAAAAYLDILNLTNKEAKLELAQEKLIKSYPLSANAQVQRVICLYNSGEYKTEDFKNECLAALKKYKKKPGEKTHTPYIQIYQQLLNYYLYINEMEKIEDAVFEIVDYDPRAFLFVYNFLWKTIEKPVDYANEQLTHPHFKETTAKIKKAIKNYEKTNPAVVPQIQYFKLKFQERIGDDVFNTAADLLNIYPHSDNIKSVLEVMRDAINPDKPEQIKQYYKMLIILAIKQPSDKEHIEIVGFLLNEKKKLETIMPEIKTQ